MVGAFVLFSQAYGQSSIYKENYNKLNNRSTTDIIYDFESILGFPEEELKKSGLIQTSKIISIAGSNRLNRNLSQNSNLQISKDMFSESSDKFKKNCYSIGLQKKSSIPKNSKFLRLYESPSRRLENIQNEWYFNDLGISKMGELVKNRPSRDIKIAIVDDGIDFSIEGLSDLQWTNPNEQENGVDSDNNGYVDDLHGWNFIDNNNNIYPTSYVEGKHHGAHGTGATSVFADKDIGIFRGDRSKLHILALKMHAKHTNFRLELYMTEILDYIIKQKVDISIMPIGVANTAIKKSMSQLFQNLLDPRTKLPRHLMFTSAGNNDKDVLTTEVVPCALSRFNRSVVCVSGCTKKHRIKDTKLPLLLETNKKIVGYHSGYSYRAVQIITPGVSVKVRRPGGEIITTHGSSVATPIAAALAATSYIADDGTLIDTLDYFSHAGIVTEHLKCKSKYGLVRGDSLVKKMIEKNSAGWNKKYDTTCDNQSILVVALSIFGGILLLLLIIFLVIFFIRKKRQSQRNILALVRDAVYDEKEE